MSHREIMLTPNNSLAPKLLYSLFSAMVFLPGILMAAQSQSPVNWSADGELLGGDRPGALERALGGKEPTPR